MASAPDEDASLLAALDAALSSLGDPRQQQALAAACSALEQRLKQLGQAAGEACRAGAHQEGEGGCSEGAAEPPAAGTLAWLPPMVQLAVRAANSLDLPVSAEGPVNRLLSDQGVKTLLEWVTALIPPAAAALERAASDTTGAVGPAVLGPCLQAAARLLKTLGSAVFNAQTAKLRQSSGGDESDDDYACLSLAPGSWQAAGEAAEPPADAGSSADRIKALSELLYEASRSSSDATLQQVAAGMRGGQHRLDERLSHLTDMLLHQQPPLSTEAVWIVLDMVQAALGLGAPCGLLSRAQSRAWQQREQRQLSQKDWLPLHALVAAGPLAQRLLTQQQGRQQDGQSAGSSTTDLYMLCSRWEHALEHLDARIRTGELYRLPARVGWESLGEVLAVAEAALRALPTVAATELEKSSAPAAAAAAAAAEDVRALALRRCSHLGCTACEGASEADLPTGKNT
ncbi:hypothetical protein ABPG75_005754 [Micractinium tetrahymenae]